VKDSS